MALVTQIIDVPLTAGVDSKTTAFTSSAPGTAQFTTISNMRSDYRAGFIPRIGYTASASGTFTSPAWVAANTKQNFYSIGRSVSSDLGTAVVSAAPGTVKRKSFGSQLDTDPVWVACAAQSSKVLTAWAYSAATAGPSTAFQWYDPATDITTQSGVIGSVFTSLQVTAGPSNAYIWGLSGGNVLSVYEVGVSGSTATQLTKVSFPAAVTAFDVVYYSSAWYVIYTTGATTRVFRTTLSGSTMTAGTEVEIHAAISANVSIAITPGTTGTNYLGMASYETAGAKVYGYLYTAVATPVLVIKSAGTAATSPIFNLGVCDSLAASPLMITYTVLTSSFLTGNAALTMSVAGAISSSGVVTSPYGSISRPVALAESPGGTPVAYVASTDIHNVATYGSAGFGSITSSRHAQSYRWSAASAVTLNTHRGTNIAVVGSRYCIPQIWEGKVEGVTNATAGFGSTSTQQTVGLVIIDETSSTYAQHFPFGTAEVISAGSLYGLDTQNVGPSGAWPIPAILASTFVEGGAGSLGAGRYSYRLLKVWSDSVGNIMEAVSPAFVATLLAVNKSFKFTVPAQAFLLAHPAPAIGAGVQIKIYRTESNGSVHYFLRSLYSTTAVTDTTADTALDFADALTYDGGELEDQELSHIIHMTSWQGRLVALTADYPTKAFYSKPPEAFRGARFAAGLEIDFPQAVGGLTALGGMDYALYGFAKNEIFTVSGQPAGATGENGSLGSPELRFKGIGCVNPKSVVLTPKGLAFQSSKGIYLILRNQELAFIGEGPFEVRTTTIIGAYVDETRSELHYILSTGAEWVYNWQDSLWTVFTSIATPYSVALQGSTPVILTAVGTYVLDSSSTEVIPITMTTDWLSLTGIQGYQRVRNVELLLEYVASHTLQVDLYTDYDETTAVQTSTIASSAITPAVGVGKAFQVRIHVQNQKCEAIKIKLSSAVAGWKISGITLEVGSKLNDYKPRAQTTPNTK